MPAAKAYRRDIQGMRALAVVSVVAYHAQVPGFGGGFTGVDIFFVVSGYLICGLLADELATHGRVDVLAFWGRRARRLLPNATLTLLAVLVASALFAPAYQFERTAREVSAAALYFANFEFAAKAVDYFRLDDVASPVLHFWSLNVEEQFYFVYPLVLAGLTAVAGGARRATIAVVLLAIATLSFAWSVWVIQDNSARAFFHPGARAWQLAAGGLVAEVARRGWRPSHTLGALLQTTGLAAIAASFILFDDNMSYPGAAALLPTAGAAALIAGGLGATVSIGVVRRALEAPACQWLGARSYSWYLWHWPAIVLAQTRYSEIAHIELVAAAASLVLAAVVYSTLERPIHESTLTAHATLPGAVASIAVVVAFGAALDAALTRRGPATEFTARLKEAAADRSRIYGDKCHLAYDEDRPRDCVYGATDAPRTVVLFGDSHAAQWFEPLEAAARERGWRLLSWTKSSCPSADVTIWYVPRKATFKACDQWRENALTALIGGLRPDLVVISNSLVYSGWIWDRSRQRVVRGQEAAEHVLAGLRRVVLRLTQANIRVAVVRDTPRAHKSFAQCLQNDGGSSCDRPRSQAEPRVAADLAVIADISDAVVPFDLNDRICGPNSCPVLREGEIIYQDHHHVTARFARRLAPEFGALLAGAER